MSFENGNNMEQQTVDPSIKQEQIDRDFDAVLKEYQNMSTQQQAEFIEAIASRDPHFNELYTQLKDYFWNNIKGLDEHLEALEIQKLFEAETEKTQELLQSQNRYFETNFSNFQNTLQETQINGVSVSVLTGKVYDGYIRYKDNPEPLIKALAGSELQQAQKALDNSLAAISTRMQAAPENMPEARLYAFKQHGEKESEILANYEKVAEKFMHLMNSDAGKMILSNTAFSSFETGLKSNISEQLGYDIQTENEITQSIENSTKELVLNLGVIEKSFDKKIKDFLQNQQGLKARDYITWQHILHHDIPKQLETSIGEEIKLYSFNVGENLIKQNASIIKQGGIFNLPIGNGENVRLDFSELGDVSELNTQEILELYKNNFDSIYRNNFGEILSDTISDIWTSVKENPGKTTIDVTSVIVAGIGAVVASKGSGTITAPLIAGPTFTLIDNGYRAGMYEAFDIEGGWKAGVGIEENDTHNDILRKKLFELGGNTLLFGMFKATGALEARFPKIDNQLASLSLKTPIEAGFFTYYSVVSENMQQTVKNDGNINELLDDFSEIPNMQALMKSYIYNLGFITAVKAGAIPAEKMLISQYQKKLNTELETLKEKGYIIMETTEGYAFYKGLSRVNQIQNKDFANFVELNKSVNYIATEQYRKPESGRGGKTAYSTSFREQKFQNLEKYSKEVQSGKIDYALKDQVIGKSLVDNGIGKKGNNVGKGLLEKSGFEKGEKIEPKTKFEKKAVREMEKANLAIYKEYKEGINKLQKGLSLRESFPNLSEKLYPKLKILFELDSNQKRKERKI